MTTTTAAIATTRAAMLQTLHQLQLDVEGCKVGTFVVFGTFVAQWRTEGGGGGGGGTRGPVPPPPPPPLNE